MGDSHEAPTPNRVQIGKTGGDVVTRPVHLNAYEFVVVSALRAQQLLSGCVPRLPGEHRPIIMAQMEVAEGRVARAQAAETLVPPRQCGWQR